MKNNKNNKSKVSKKNIKGKKTETKKIITGIISSLKQGDKSISEVAEDAHINWETAQTYLNILTQTGILEKQTQGNKIMYTLLQKQENTLFGLPLSKEKQNIINFIFSKIKEEYKKLHNKDPNRTYMQKTTVEIIKQANLNIPVVWYLYGKICICLYAEDKEYEFKNFKEMKEIEKIIKNNIKEYDFESTRKMKEKQYKENSIYQIKEILNSKLLENRNIQKDFMEFYKEIIQNGLDGETADILNEFSSLIYENQDLSHLFNEIWRFIALKIASKDLEKYYSIELLNYLFEDRVKEQENIISDIFREIFEKIEYPETDKKLIDLQEKTSKKAG